MLTILMSYAEIKNKQKNICLIVCWYRQRLYIYIHNSKQMASKIQIVGYSVKNNELEMVTVDVNGKEYTFKYYGTNKYNFCGPKEVLKALNNSSRLFTLAERVKYNKETKADLAKRLRTF